MTDEKINKIQVNKRKAIPLYSIALTGVINALLALINIGSTVAFNAVVSLVVAGFLSSYLLAIVVMIHKRLTTNEIALGLWNLGRFGLAINIYAALYTVITVVFSFFPPSTPVDKESMNYSCVVYGGTIIFGVVYYMVHGHKAYIGPRLPRLPEMNL